MSHPTTPRSQSDNLLGSPGRAIAVILAFVILHLIMDRASMLFFTLEGIGLWFLPAGLVFIALLAMGPRFAPIVLATKYISHWLLAPFPEMPTAGILLMAAIVTAGYLLGAVVLRRITAIDLRFPRLMDIIAFSVVALVSAFLVGLASVTALAAFGLLNEEWFALSVVNWWIGDAIGILTVAPFILVNMLHRRATWLVLGAALPVTIAVELIGWLVVLALFLIIAFISPVADFFHLLYFVLLPLIWISLRYGLPGATLAVLCVSGGTALMLWAFGATAYFLLDIQIFMLIMTLTGLTLGVISSARIRAEQGLRASEERFRAVTESATDAIVVIDEDSRVIFANSTVETIFGYRRDDVVGQPLTMLMPDYLRVPHLKGIEDYLLTGQRHVDWKAVEQSGWHRDGHEIPLEISYSEFISEGRHYFTGIIRDTTERTQAEDALRRERVFLSSAIDLLPFPIVFSAPDGTVIRANQASYRFFPDADSSHWWRAEWIAPDTHIAVPREQWPMMRSVQGEVVMAAEGIMALSDGREIPVLAHSAPVYIDDQLVATVVAFQDITALKEADRAKNRFLAVLSHELRTPLTNVLGWAREALETPDISREALEIIVRNAQAQLRMLEDLLDVSRLLHGKLLLQRTRQDLWTLVTRSIEGVKAATELRQVAISAPAPAEPLPIDADARRLTQVVANILENAIKFSDTGGNITIKAWREGGEALLAIRDMGRGIAPEMLATLFQPFQQIERTETAGGLGLGLMLVKGIIELHGGEVTATSSGLAQGSTFVMRLPLATSESSSG